MDLFQNFRSNHTYGGCRYIRCRYYQEVRKEEIKEDKKGRKNGTMKDLSKTTKRKKLWGIMSRMWWVREVVLTNLAVSPITQIGACADWDTSNRLYSNVWFLCAANRSNSSNTNRIDLLCWPPNKKCILFENVKYCKLQEHETSAFLFAVKQVLLNLNSIE